MHKMILNDICITQSFAMKNAIVLLCCSSFKHNCNANDYVEFRLYNINIFLKSKYKYFHYIPTYYFIFKFVQI